MNPDRWAQVEQLYDAALEREPESRAAFLDEACAEDSDFRREVEELLRYDGAAAQLHRRECAGCWSRLTLRQMRMNNLPAKTRQRQSAS